MNPMGSHPINFSIILVCLFVLLCHQFGKSESRIPEHQLRDRFYRSWSEWSSWSSCSRSCGVGVTVRTRVCRMRLAYHPIPLPKTCAGENVEHKLCEIQNCPSSDEDFVSYQCSLHNGHPFRGDMILEWIPYEQNDNLCELQCQAKDGSRLYSFGKVIDGTECGSKHPAICVNGRCTKIDCSGQLGADGQLDMCGVCRGDNSTCVRYQNSYWGRPRRKNLSGPASATDQHYDYNHIARIPSGATKILIKESSDTNFLALMDKMGKIVINSNWRVSSPGTVNTAGTEFTYSRTSDGEDVLSAPGPTQSDLFILILGRGDIPTVEYEYWYSKKSEQKYVDTQKKSQYYVGEEKDKSSALVSSLRNKNKQGYEGYHSYYHRNEIIPSQYETKFGYHNLSQSSTENANALDQKKTERRETIGTTTFLLMPSVVTPFALNRHENSSVTFNADDMKSRQPLEPVSSPASDRLLDSDQASVNRVPSHLSTELPPEVPSDRKMSLSKDVYISNAILPSEDSLNESNQNRNLQNVQITPSRTATRYSALSKPTYVDPRIPSDLKWNHYDIESSPGNLSSTQLSFVTPRQPCTKRPNIEGFLSRIKKGQKSETLELPNKKENNEFPVITKLTYTKRKRERKGNGKVKRFHKELSDMKPRKKKRKRKSNKDQCLPCKRVKQQTKNFCKSDFVLRIIVTSSREVKGETQFEIQVIQSYMNKIPILSREYLWRLDSCRCPRLHLNREYIVMGHSAASAARNRESRLYVDAKSFVRRYGRKRAESVLRLARDKVIVCKKFLSSEE